MSLLSRTGRSQLGRASPFWLGDSDINSFDFGERILRLNSEVSHGAFDSSVTGQRQ